MSSSIAASVTDLIGNTPLIRLKGPSAIAGAEILGKAEFMNPGQSIKDRAALAIIRDAEAKGRLKPGGVIVEGTAGNTGIGIAMVARALGYRAVIVMPRTQSIEKKNAVKLLGAELVEVDALPYREPGNYVRYSGRLAEALAARVPEGAIWANQFDNTANRQAHIDGTGPEIWRQTGGKIDGFTCAVGSGGTLAGVAQALRSFQPDIKIALSDPAGAALYRYYTTGELASEGSSITEGIGQGRITANLEGFKPDYAYRIEDPEWAPLLYNLMLDEGLSLGGSSALNVAGAIRLARDLGPGSTVVTILCDAGNRYASKFFDLPLLAEKGLPAPPWGGQSADSPLTGLDLGSV